MDEEDDEIKKFVRVWGIAITLLSYCYFIASRFPKGLPRLFVISPVIYIFTILPSNLNFIHFSAPATFFFTWLANFKLILFAFDQLHFLSLSPISTSFQLTHFFHFIAIFSLPIQIKQTHHQIQIQIPENEKPTTSTLHDPAFLFIFKIFLMGFLILISDLRHRLNPDFVFIFYCLQLNIALEVLLGIYSLPARAIFMKSSPLLSLDRQFNDPYLSTSLQDFWGRRWNLMAPNILRDTVYNPTRMLTSGLFGHRFAKCFAMIASFTVSGLMHELLYYYLTRASPTWEVTSFFLLHGICTAAEVAVKAAMAGRFRRLPRGVSNLLTLGFLIITGKWLFFPQLIRNGFIDRAIGEYSIMFNYVKTKITMILPI